MSAAQAKAVMDTYGKVIITWNSKDTLPTFPPQIEQVQHPFMDMTLPKQRKTGAYPLYLMFVFNQTWLTNEGQF